MDYKILEFLHHEGKIGNKSFDNIAKKRKSPISLELEIKAALYLSIIVFTYCLGLLAYKNIDTIGHTVIISTIGIITVASFYYGLKNKKPFQYEKSESVSNLYDYIVLLGALSFIIFVAYLQFKYEVFGTKYGLATFITMCVLFAAAYIYDHIGILSLAISNLALWLGITVTPKKLLLNGDFKTFSLVITAILLSVVLLGIGEYSKRFKFKPHFRFTYLNFGVHIGFISILSGLFNLNYFIIWFLALLIISILSFMEAYKEKSFYFIVIITGYFYIGLSYSFIRLMDTNIFRNEADLYIMLFYFIITSIALVFGLIHLNKKLNERI